MKGQLLRQYLNKVLGGTQLGRLAGSWAGGTTTLNPAREEARMGVESKASMYTGAGRPQEKDDWLWGNHGCDTGFSSPISWPGLLRASRDEELEGPRTPLELPANRLWGRLAGPSPASFPGSSQVHSSWIHRMHTAPAPHAHSHRARHRWARHHASHPLTLQARFL